MSKSQDDHIKFGQRLTNHLLNMPDNEISNKDFDPYEPFRESDWLDKLKGEENPLSKQKMWLDKYGYPIEKIKGRPIIYFFRVVFHGKRRGYYKQNLSPDPLVSQSTSFTVTTERGVLRERVQEALRDKNGLDFQQAIAAVFEALRGDRRAYPNSEKPCPICGRYDADEETKEPERQERTDGKAEG